MRCHAYLHVRRARSLVLLQTRATVGEMAYELALSTKKLWWSQRERYDSVAQHRAWASKYVQVDGNPHRAKSSDNHWAALYLPLSFPCPRAPPGSRSRWFNVVSRTRGLTASADRSFGRFELWGDTDPGDSAERLQNPCSKPIEVGWNSLMVFVICLNTRRASWSRPSTLARGCRPFRFARPSPLGSETAPAKFTAVQRPVA